MEVPLSKQREYKSLILKNKLRVILVHDKNKSNSGACLSVHVGKVLEPKNIPGLAHFCEHMMSKGSEKYPSESLLKEFVKKNGGKRNATTSDYSTSYYFEVPQAKYDECLDIYASSFVAPALTESAVLREVNAVNNEHEMKLKIDSRRMYSLLMEQVHEDHPLHWGSGNTKSLITNVEKQGLSLREELIKFYEKYYSANIMTLCLVSNDSIEDLEAKAVKYFSAIPNKNVEIAYGEPLNNVDPFMNSKFEILQYYKPCKEIMTVSFCFRLPWQRGLWKTKPTSLITFILGHEGEGSLLSYLKAKGLASSLNCYTEDFSAFTVLKVSVSVLTDDCVEMEGVKDIGQAIFYLIRLMQKQFTQNSPYFLKLWEETKSTRKLSFDFAHFNGAMKTARQTARKALILKPGQLQHAFSVNRLLFEYDNKAVQSLLGFLEPNLTRIEIVHPKFGDDHNVFEEWYGSSAKNLDIPDILISSLKENVSFEEIFLPKPNRFLPTDMRIFNSEDKKVVAPELLKTEFGKIYFRPDTVFMHPKAYCSFTFYLPKVTSQEENSGILQLWLACVKEEMNELRYEAKLAGLYFSLGATQTGLVLEVGGFNENLIILLKEVLQKIKLKMNSTISSSVFNTVHDTYYKSSKNSALKSRLFNHCFSEFFSMVGKYARPKQAFFETVSMTKKHDLDVFGKDLFNDCYVEGLCSGNLSRISAQEICMEVLSTFTFVKPKKLVTRGTAFFEKGKYLLRVYQGIDEVEANNAVSYIFQIKPSRLNECYTKVLAKAVGSEFSHRLRTQKQLGYICSASYSAYSGTSIDFYFCIQSQYPASYLINCMEAFIETRIAKELFEDSFISDFEKVVEGCVSTLETEHKNISSQFHEDFVRIRRREFEFNERELKINLFKNMKLESFRDFVTHLLKETPRIVVEGTGPKDTEAKRTLVSKLSEEDIRAIDYDGIIENKEESMAFREKAQYTHIDSNL